MAHSTEGIAEDPHAFWITTSTGLKFYPKDPEGSSYRIEDIAHGLAQTCRFGGQCSEFYSVAEHSVLVSRVAHGLAGTSQLYQARLGLLHDASEAYLCDLPRPIKYLPEMEGYRVLEKRVMAAIRRTFGLGDGDQSIVKEADNLMLRSEAEKLKLLNADWDVARWPKVRYEPVPLSPVEAEREFYARFVEIFDPERVTDLLMDNMAPRKTSR